MHVFLFSLLQMQKPPGQLPIQAMLSSFCVWSITVIHRTLCGTVLTSWKLWLCLLFIQDHPRYVYRSQHKPFRPEMGHWEKKNQFTVDWVKMFCCLLSQGGTEGLLTPDAPAIAEGKGCADPSSVPLLPHPAKKQVWDFVRVLLMDSLLNIPANKQGHPLELLLEVSPVSRLCCSTLPWGWKDRTYPASDLVKKS